jgi:hypothetical protein
LRERATDRSTGEPDIPSAYIFARSRGDHASFNDVPITWSESSANLMWPTTCTIVDPTSSHGSSTYRSIRSRCPSLPRYRASVAARTRTATGTLRRVSRESGPVADGVTERRGGDQQRGEAPALGVPVEEHLADQAHEHPVLVVRRVAGHPDARGLGEVVGGTACRSGDDVLPGLHRVLLTVVVSPAPWWSVLLSEEHLRAQGPSPVSTHPTPTETRPGSRG